MEAKYFKFMFQNTNDAIYHTGCLWNTYTESFINFLYISSIEPNLNGRVRHDARFSEETFPLDFLVISYLNYTYMEHVIELLDRRKIYKVIMPYFNIEERKKVLHRYRETQAVSREVEEFWDSPYMYFKRKGIEEVYLISGNGENYKGEEFLPGDYFDEYSTQECKTLQKGEARYIPIYKAGYMVYDNWLFYFSNFREGTDSSLVLYHGSISDNTKLEDCVLNVKSFSGMLDCSSQITSKNSQCYMACTHKTDYDCLKRHNRKNMKQYINGTLLTGNINMHDKVDMIYDRYYSVKEKIRFIGVPNSGSYEYWDKRIMGFGNQHYKSYWAVPSNRNTSAETIKEISLSSPYNNFVLLNEGYGLCISGYLKKRADISLRDIY